VTSRRLLARGSWPEARYVASALRTETVGGALLLGAAAAALVWANTPWPDAYASLRDLVVGPHALHLDLSLGTWAADGLLALFFLVAGIELKREFVAGDLSDRSKAALPIAAAACGVAVPALLYAGTARLVGAEAEVFRGWAIPTATDIAFALAVLAVIATHLPSALRSFLLTLAVVDDLIAITIIAIFYTGSELAPGWLLLAVVPLAAWWWLLRRGWTNPALLAVPALLAWGLVHASGVHATVAGVLLGLLVPVAKRVEQSPDEQSLAERMEHALRPWSAGVAVPVFAFFAAGVTIGPGGLGPTFADPGGSRRHRGPGRGQVPRGVRWHLRVRAVQQGHARRGPRVERRVRPLPVGGGGVHRVPAHRGARVWDGLGAGRPRPARCVAGVGRVGSPRRGRAARAEPALPAGGGGGDPRRRRRRGS
jgi:NhaA family Na+:H+ antiporter